MSDSNKLKVNQDFTPTFKEDDLVMLLKDYPPNMYDICDDLIKKGAFFLVISCELSNTFIDDNKNIIQSEKETEWCQLEIIVGATGKYRECVDVYAKAEDLRLVTDDDFTEEELKEAETVLKIAEDKFDQDNLNEFNEDI